MGMRKYIKRFQFLILSNSVKASQVHYNISHTVFILKYDVSENYLMNFFYVRNPPYPSHNSYHIKHVNPLMPDQICENTRHFSTNCMDFM
mgnify:CR=1 FL=1